MKITEILKKMNDSDSYTGSLHSLVLFSDFSGKITNEDEQVLVSWKEKEGMSVTLDEVNNNLDKKEIKLEL